MKRTFTILILFLSFHNLFCQVDSAVIILKTETQTDTISGFKISDAKTHFYKADLTPWTLLLSYSRMTLRLPAEKKASR